MLETKLTLALLPNDPQLSNGGIKKLKQRRNRMAVHFSKRMNKIRKSFIREILKVTLDPTVISFAGGLPNPSSFPVKEVQDAVNKTLKIAGEKVFQYSITEGFLPLRQYIAERYFKRFGLNKCSSG